MKHKYIYIFYIMVLLSAISWRVTRAYPSLSEIKDINIVESDNQTLINIDLSKATKVVPYLKGSENCFILEFDKSTIAESLKTKAFASRDVKLGYLSLISGDKNTDKNSKPVSQKKVKARFFLKPECIPSIKYLDNKVVLKLSVKENLNKLHQPSNSLMHPSENKFAPVVLSLENAPFKPVVSEIAAQAGMDLHFKGNFPETFSIELQSEDPFNAICSIAVKTNVNFYRDGKTWYMEGSAE
ncbi:MAG: hypothetical protein IKO19_12415 [Candidatus Riflebacteria bacterium]|nr:hypothetical protein [Candidatus Riflebacteria bacterium]MBR4571454.1 hypothetical protein [Candidatus Riflebacteria bacterium]